MSNNPYPLCAGGKVVEVVAVRVVGVVETTVAVVVVVSSAELFRVHPAVASRNTVAMASRLIGSPCLI
jgi:hypothetical protein